jgi:hypothetical protein
MGRGDWNVTRKLVTDSRYYYPDENYGIDNDQTKLDGAARLSWHEYNKSPG